MKTMFVFNNYQFAFSFKGLLVVALVMLPNLVYAFLPVSNDVLSGNQAPFWLWNLLENMMRFAVIISFCFLVNRKTIAKNNIICYLALISLVAYYILWIAYYFEIYNGVSLVGLAVFPSIFFILSAWKQENVIAFLCASGFAILHITITSNNFLF